MHHFALLSVKACEDIGSRNSCFQVAMGGSLTRFGFNLVLVPEARQGLRPQGVVKGSGMTVKHHMVGGRCTSDCSIAELWSRANIRQAATSSFLSSLNCGGKIRCVAQGHADLCAQKSLNCSFSMF